MALTAWWGTAKQVVDPEHTYTTALITQDVPSGMYTMAITSDSLVFRALMELASVLGVAAAALIATAGLIDPGIVKGAAAGRNANRKQSSDVDKKSANAQSLVGQHPFDLEALATLPSGMRRTLAQTLRASDLEEGNEAAGQPLRESTETLRTRAEAIGKLAPGGG